MNDLAKHATPTEAKVLKALAKHGTIRKAAKALVMARGSVSGALTRLRRRAAKVDPQQHTHQAPVGYWLRGASTLLDAEGRVVQQWVKTAPDGIDPQALADDFRAALAEDFPRASATRAPAVTDADLMAVYPWGDPHFGMLAWAPESGADYDLAIAEKHHCAAIDALVDRAPSAESAAFINVGDASHADSASATTTAGTRVDVDSRYPKVQQTIIRVWVYAIKRMLTKHRTVYMINAIGNHDTNTSFWISECLRAYFKYEPRVVIDPGVSKYQYLEFGRNLICVTHGDGCAPKDLGGVMLVQRPESMARTKYRYWYTGHIHHESKREYAGYIFESFRTLAPKDGWHASKGYMSGQSMVMDVLHSERGRVERHEVGVEEIRKRTA